MKGYLYYMVYAAILLGLLCGCGGEVGRHEMEGLFLVEVLGVDWGETRVRLTAADEERLLTAEGETAAESHQDLKQSGEAYVALTHVEHIVAGAESDLRAVLEGALRGEEVGQTATVWLAARGSARELLEQAGGGAKRLDAIQNNTGGFRPVTVMAALVCLEETGEVTLPALEERDGRLTLVGELVWSGKP